MTIISIDVMSSITMSSRLLETQQTLAQLEYVPLLDATFEDGLHHGFPCSNQILQSIIEINHARCLSAHHAGSASSLEALYAQILGRIEAFDPVVSSRNQLRRQILTSQSSTVSIGKHSTKNLALAELGKVEEQCEDLAKAFQYSVMLYCIRTLYIDRGVLIPSPAPQPQAMDSPTSPMIEPGALHQLTLAKLLEVLRLHWATKKRGSSWLGRFLFWPLWVAGMELDPGPAMEQDRRFIHQALKELCYHLGSLAPLDAASMLQLVWDKTLQDSFMGEQSTWDMCVALPGFQGLFFI